MTVALLVLAWVLCGLVPLALDIPREEWRLGLRLMWLLNWRFAAFSAVTGPIVPVWMLVEWASKKPNGGK